MSKIFSKVLRVFGLFFLISVSAPAVSDESKLDGGPESIRQSRIKTGGVGSLGMVSSDDRMASEWGTEILSRGGNAIDAAVATAFMLAVTRPDCGSIGGGGFLVYCPGLNGAKNSAIQNCSTLDYRERAPAKATRDMFIKNGKADSELSQVGALASGVPGVVAGLVAAHQKFGKRKLSELLVKPIQIAKGGFKWIPRLEADSQEQWETFNPEAKRIFGCSQSHHGQDLSVSKAERTYCKAGALIKQPELAQVLSAISSKGRAGFYEGPVAVKIAAGLQAAQGIITVEDLRKYQPTWRDPVVGTFKDLEVVTMPPPSSGGLLLIQLLGFAERAERQGNFKGGWGSISTIHALTHALSLSFADRTKYFGDGDFFKVPQTQLTESVYLDQRWKSFNPKKAQLPDAPGEISTKKEPTETTHFSVIDRDGNAVGLTTTINENYGSGFVPPGTGVVMNNEMDDFSAQPGVPNLFGLIGAEANAIEPGKRPLSSMTPTILRTKEGQVRFVLGAAGGPRIISAVYQVLVNRLILGMSLPDAVTAGRIHHQWKPESLRMESHVFAAEVRAGLTALGYKLDVADKAFAVVHALERYPNGRVWGVSDPRSEGVSAAH